MSAHTAQTELKLIGKLILEGEMLCESGLHVGAGKGSLEIGGTYYHPQVRGGPVNPASKRLMMAHAFESGARRVQYKVDAINARSRAAVLKLGATQVGILRQDRVTWTGRIRDTVVFSILAAAGHNLRIILRKLRLS